MQRLLSENYQTEMNIEEYEQSLKKPEPLYLELLKLIEIAYTNNKNKECTCGVLRRIENGHYEDCPRYEISPRQKKYKEAIDKALKKDKKQ